MYPNLESLSFSSQSGLLCYCERCVNRTCNTTGLCYAVVTKSAGQIVIQEGQCIQQDQLYPPDRPFQCASSNNGQHPYCCNTHMCNKNPKVSPGKWIMWSCWVGFQEFVTITSICHKSVTIPKFIFGLGLFCLAQYNDFKITFLVEFALFFLWLFHMALHRLN